MGDISSDILRVAVFGGEPWSRICASHIKLRVKTLGTPYSSEIFLLSRFDPIISILSLVIFQVGMIPP